LAGGAAIVSEHKVLREVSGQLSGKHSQLKCETTVALRREVRLCDQILAHGGAQFVAMPYQRAQPCGNFVGQVSTIDVGGYTLGVFVYKQRWVPLAFASLNLVSSDFISGIHLEAPFRWVRLATAQCECPNEAAFHGRRFSRFFLISDGKCIAQFHRIAAWADFLDQVRMATAKGVFADVIKLGRIPDTDLPAQHQPVRLCGFGHNAPRADGRASVRPHARNYLVRVMFTRGARASWTRWTFVQDAFEV
jgi:hypothetical protein